MAKATEMVRLLEEALTKNVGVNQITADGQTVTFASREAMLNELDYWQRKAAKERGNRHLFKGFDVGSAW